jgi:hypothetical protein
VKSRWANSPHLLVLVLFLIGSGVPRIAHLFGHHHHPHPHQHESASGHGCHFGPCGSVVLPSTPDESDPKSIPADESCATCDLLAVGGTPLFVLTSDTIGAVIAENIATPASIVLSRNAAAPISRRGPPRR